MGEKKQREIDFSTVAFVECGGGPCQLYRHFSDTGELLYVGISLSAIERLRQHKDVSEWFNQIKRVEIDCFPTRGEALVAERAAIKTESPKYNKQCVEVSRRNPGIIEKELKPNGVYSVERASIFLGKTFNEMVSLITRNKVDYVLVEQSKLIKMTGQQITEAKAVIE